MKDNAAEWMVFNNKIIPGQAFDEKLMEGRKAAYEVIRIIKGTPLYFEDHCRRMQNSLVAIGLGCGFSEQELGKQVRQVVEANKLTDCNVRVVVYGDSDKQDVLCHISASYYPPMEEVLRGVAVSSLQLERNNPNVKQVNLGYKEKVNQKMKDDGVFEVLLVNQDGKLTEGSRSNAFFIKGDKVFTAPGEYVLKGITREYIMETCRQLGYQVVETLVDRSRLKEMDGLFISGTSIKVLPVSSVDGETFQSPRNPVITAIREAFDKTIDRYILTHRDKY